MTERPQQPPAAVPQSAKQAGDVRARWAWTEAAVWTERMLTALEKGVKGILCRPWAVLPVNRLRLGLSILKEVIPSTGEPDAGEPHVRFGGRGGRTQSALPTPIWTT